MVWVLTQFRSSLSLIMCDITIRVGAKRKACTELVGAISSSNIRLRDENEHLKAKIRRLIELQSSASTERRMPTSEQRGALHSSTTTAENSQPRPECGPEETGATSRAVPAAPAQSPPTVGLGHMLAFLSIVLHTFNGAMPGPLAIRLLACLPTTKATRVVAMCDVDCTVDPAGARHYQLDDIMRHDRVIEKWEQLLVQHQMKPAELELLVRALCQMRKPAQAPTA